MDMATLYSLAPVVFTVLDVVFWGKNNERNRDEGGEDPLGWKVFFMRAYVSPNTPSRLEVKLPVNCLLLERGPDLTPMAGSFHRNVYHGHTQRQRKPTEDGEGCCERNGKKALRFG